MKYYPKKEGSELIPESKLLRDAFIKMERRMIESEIDNMNEDELHEKMIEAGIEIDFDLLSNNIFEMIENQNKICSAISQNKISQDEIKRFNLMQCRLKADRPPVYKTLIDHTFELQSAEDPTLSLTLTLNSKSGEAKLYVSSENFQRYVWTFGQEDQPLSFQSYVGGMYCDLEPNQMILLARHLNLPTEYLRWYDQELSATGPVISHRLKKGQALKDGLTCAQSLLVTKVLGKKIDASFNDLREALLNSNPFLVSPQLATRFHGDEDATRHLSPTADRPPLAEPLLLTKECENHSIRFVVAWETPPEQPPTVKLLVDEATHDCSFYWSKWPNGFLSSNNFPLTHQNWQLGYTWDASAQLLTLNITTLSAENEA